MIKLKQILFEEIYSQRPNKSLDLYLLKNRLQKFDGTLYHGSPMEGLKQIILNGINGTEHGEIAEYSTFSTSINDQVLRLFSDGDGVTGVQFDVSGINLIVIDDFIHKLMIELQGSGMEVDVNEKEFIAFCKQYQVPQNSRGEYYLPYGYLTSLGVDAFIFDYTWKKIKNGHGASHNDESEIAFVGDGIKKLNNMVDCLWVDGSTYDINEKQQALEAIDEY